MPAILIPEYAVAYQILALNTEKAHNLKEKSLEVIRMYRGLAGEQPRASEEDFTFQFEAPHFITLGLLYEENKRFAGGAFAPILKRVDKFLKGKLPATLEEREERAAKVKAADAALAGAVAALKKRGINHPFVKNYVLARTTPLTRARKTLPSLRPDLHQARGRDRSLRRGQGPLRGRAAQRGVRAPPGTDPDHSEAARPSEGMIRPGQSLPHACEWSSEVEAARRAPAAGRGSTKSDRS